MRIVFRSDASIQIGTGHVMRCLTLADALADQGAECHFICREHPGHLLPLIAKRGHQVHILPSDSDDDKSPTPAQNPQPLAHAQWLGATQAVDAQQCQPIIKSLKPDWLFKTIQNNE